MNVELVLELLDAPIAAQRPLPDGTNPWEIISYDPREAKRIGYRKQLEQGGVVVDCENPDCGKSKRVHPAKANNTFACSVACASKMARERKAGRSTRVPMEIKHRMWEYKKQNRKEAS